MARKARDKEEKLPHHIISRSIEEVRLFSNDDDKEVYLGLLKKNARIFQIEILAYCLMDNHVHLLVHPRGGDISRFMHGINNSFAKYYNRAHKRRGHLFSERFSNKVVRGLNQLLRNSVYIHCNAKDLLHKGYKSIEDYPYSSIKDYTEPGNGRGIATPNWTFRQMSKRWKEAWQNYKVMLRIQNRGAHKCVDVLLKEPKYCNDGKRYIRKCDADRVIAVVAKATCVKNTSIRHIKYEKKYRKFKAVLAVSLRIYCGLSLSEMTEIFMNHTSSAIGILANEGFAMFENDVGLQGRLESSLFI